MCNALGVVPNVPWVRSFLVNKPVEIEEQNPLFRLKAINKFLVLMIGLSFCPLSLANEEHLRQRVIDLEKRVAEIEARLEGGASFQRWRDSVLWSRLKRGMSQKDVQTLLGKPGRVEEQIFMTWYYHATSKRHSFVWFDEGKVLGWTAPKGQ